MDAKQIFATLRARAPWKRVARIILREAGIDVSRGWDSTDAYTHPNAVTDDQLAKLETGLKEHLIAGEKSVRLYKVSRTHMAEFRTWAASARRGSGELVEAFPAMIPDSELSGREDTRTRLASREEFETGTALIFTAIRSYKQRDHLNPDAVLRAKDAEKYTEVIGIRLRHLQTYETIWIPNDSNDYVCAACDNPEDAPNTFADASHRNLRGYIEMDAANDIQPVNLFPAIRKINEDAAEGRLVELGFQTDHESSKLLTARAGGRRSLRDDDYHKGGAAAVNQKVTPYRAGVSWRRARADKQFSEPELRLLGTARHLHVGNLHVNDATVRNAIDVEDLRFVVAKLISHL